MWFSYLLKLFYFFNLLNGTIGFGKISQQFTKTKQQNVKTNQENTRHELRLMACLLVRVYGELKRDKNAFKHDAGNNLNNIESKHRTLSAVLQRVRNHVIFKLSPTRACIAVRVTWEQLGKRSEKPISLLDTRGARAWASEGFFSRMRDYSGFFQG